jgi:hypothetical protein
MANNKNSNAKQPGEKAEGKFHYNPGNMSGKKSWRRGVRKENDGDKLQSRDELPERLIDF